MERVIAMNLIKEGVTSSLPVHWADVGAGNGVFTEALAQLIQTSGSIVYAIDKDYAALQNIEQQIGDVSILRMPIDFLLEEIPLIDLDGILMANSLHFVRDKIALLTKLKKKLKQTGRMLFIEYDTLTPNQWIPYPINYVTLHKIMIDLGFSSVTKLGERPSKFNHSLLYAALVRSE